MKTLLLASLLLPILAVAQPAAKSSIKPSPAPVKPAASSEKPFPASDKPLSAPVKPASARSYWSETQAKLVKEGGVILVDSISGKNITAPGWMKLEPGVGFTLDGTQTAPARAGKEMITSDLCVGIDLKPAGTGVEFQTPFYLFGYCELRYRLSKSEITFNIWQGGKTVSSITLPITTGKWNRIQLLISGTTARLTVNGMSAESTISEDWSGAVYAPLMLGFGGESRPFTGSFNHLILAEKP